MRHALNWARSSTSCASSRGRRLKGEVRDRDRDRARAPRSPANTAPRKTNRTGNHYAHGPWYSYGYRRARQAGEKLGIAAYAMTRAATEERVAAWRKRAARTLRHIVGVVMDVCYEQLRKAVIVLQVLTAALKMLDRDEFLPLWDNAPFISLAVGVNYFSGQHSDTDCAYGVDVFCWRGARGRVPKGGEWVMSQLGLSCDLGEFDVIVFNAREPHSLARFHGAESDWGGERYSLAMYVPMRVVECVGRIVKK